MSKEENNLTNECPLQNFIVDGCELDINLEETDGLVVAKPFPLCVCLSAVTYLGSQSPKACIVWRQKNVVTFTCDLGKFKALIC